MADESDIVQTEYRAGFASIGRAISLAPDWDAKRTAWRNGLHEALTQWNGVEQTLVIDELYLLAEAKNLTDNFGVDAIQADIAEEITELESKPPRQPNGKGYQGPDAEAEIVPPPQPKRATPYDTPDPADIPKRAWLYGGHYIRQVTTATVAPGGYGKTTLTLYEALNMVAAGLIVWYLSGEDPKVEIDRRIAAHCQWYGVKLPELPGKLFVDDKTTFPLTIGSTVRPPLVKFEEAQLTQFESAITEDNIDVVMLDPLVSFHAVPENDNGCIDAVVKRLGLIAYRTNSCIELSHHVRKSFQGQNAISVEDSRGGSAIINAVRSGRVINRMSSSEAEEANVSRDDRHFFIRLDKGKRNMAPPDKAVWFRLVSVVIGNTDNVQALDDKWKYPTIMDDVTSEDTEWVRDLVNRKAYRADPRSDDWLGKQIAARLGYDVTEKADTKKINKLIGIWLSNKVFKTMEMRASDRKPRLFYVGMSAQAESDDGKLFDDRRDDIGQAVLDEGD
jgi:hypothetical protein